ncbi:DUF2651 family protein [Aureibacillus halotolerans]|uniref:Uncharacterized protein DUF2651 n=1 Tax=Aureibacillus halotolerans TaxID=1508390 RepID=A0A4R6TXR6_9BACI|nr:DUF2651 family protein [Aureibacillus halotolerans]TDQ34603.1 uncharacterized protein DUF2651 [Aureibacillus halotolerans]
MNLFLLLIIVYPLVTILLTAVLWALTRKVSVPLIVTFVVFVLLMFFEYNTTFLIWVLVYTVISLVTSLLLKKRKR